MKRSKAILVVMGAVLVTALAGTMLYFSQRKVLIPKRNIASIQNEIYNLKNVSFDLTEFQNLDLIHRMKFRLVETAEVRKEEGQSKIILGNMKFLNPRGKVHELCEEFSKLILTFRAANTIVSGDLPSLKMEVPCKAENARPVLAEIIFPSAQIQKLATTVTTWASENASFEFANVGDTWPSEWDLAEIQMRMDQDPDYFKIIGAEVAKIRGETLRVEF